MKIGTLLTAAIVSLSAVGGGLAVYVAVSKYQTMDKVSLAQSRLEVVRAVGDIPRYMNSERGFSTNILYGPPAVDPAVRKDKHDFMLRVFDAAEGQALGLSHYLTEPGEGLPRALELAERIVTSRRPP